MSHQAAADALPLRDAFAVLFFVSVGMLLDPTFLVDVSARDPGDGRRSSSSRKARRRSSRSSTLFGYPIRTGLTVGVGLAQIGEFSFILGTVGLTARAAARPRGSS